MAVRSKKGSPYQVGKEVWVRAKVTRLAPYSAQMPDMTMITVEMPNGNRETMNLSEDRVRPADDEAE